MKRIRDKAAVGLLALVVLIPAGCARLKSAISPGEDLAEKRRQRSTQVAEEFGARRDFAEFQAAQTCWLEGKDRECEQRLHALLQRSPEHLDARLLLAEVLLTDNRANQAIEVLRPALAAHPNDARVQYSMGLLLDAAGQRQQAQVHYEQAVKLEPHNEVYQVSYEQAVVGEAWAEGLPPEASRTPQALFFRPAQAPPVESRGVSARFVETSGRSEDAQTAGTAGRVEDADWIDPAVETTVQTTAELLRQGAEALAQGNSSKALACFRRAIAEAPNDPQIPISASVSALRHNRPEVAIELLQQATKQFPDSAALQRILGTAYYRWGDYRASQVALQQALSLDKSCALSYFLMGCTLVKLGQAEAAEGHFRQAQLLDPKYALRR